MQKLMLTILLFISVAAVAQQTETRKVSSFTKLEVGGSFDTELKQGSEPSVKISYQNIDP